MIPIGDENPRTITPFVNYAIILVNTIIYLYEYIVPSKVYDEIIVEYGFIPARFLQTFNFLQIFTSMFIHADLLHLLGNMLYLYIFGDNIEDALGHSGYLLFYLLSGIGASTFHFLSDPLSPYPAIGASGAISGVLGAYFVLYPLSRVRTLVTLGFFTTFIRVPAFVYLFIWFIYQIFYASLPSVSGVAYWAHIGGFVVGIFLIKVFPKRRKRRSSYFPSFETSFP
jgi:membrane associated rhomboid family serine protease